MRRPPGPGFQGSSFTGTRTAISSQRDVRAGLLEVQVRGDLAVFEGEHGLDQAGDSGRRFQVADVGLDGADEERRRSRLRPWHSAAPSASTSMGSPSEVPVPWAST